MPTYEYFCQANNQLIDVLHRMDETLQTWGDVCDCAGVELGDTPAHAIVEKKLSATSILPTKEFSSTPGNGCGNGGCGCSGH